VSRDSSRLDAPSSKSSTSHTGYQRLSKFLKSRTNLAHPPVGKRADLFGGEREMKARVDGDWKFDRKEN